LKIYKTWNGVIANYLPVFKHQDFIVFKPETEEEKDFLFNFFNVFLSSFVKELEKSFEEIQKINKNFQINSPLKILLETNKFYLMTAWEEYIVPRDTFIELMKLVKETFLFSINNRKEKENNTVITKKDLKAFEIINSEIKINMLNFNIQDTEEQNKVTENEIEQQIIEFIDKNILSKFDKKKNKTSYN